MRAFLIPEGTQIRFIPDQVEWYGNNFREAETKAEKMFFVEDLVIDPTGIGRNANGPGNVTVGSAWAAAGWYGFRFTHPQHGPVTVLASFKDVQVC